MRGADAYNYAVNNAGRIRQLSLNTGTSQVANRPFAFAPGVRRSKSQIVGFSLGCAKPLLTLDRPVAMTTSGGPAIAWAAKYDPFGNVVTITNVTALTARFPGNYPPLAKATKP